MKAVTASNIKRISVCILRFGEGRKKKRSPVDEERTMNGVNENEKILKYFKEIQKTSAVSIKVSKCM